MTRQRFVFLDGLRGLAALAVVGYHAGFGFGLKLYPAHGYLAVDFFFCLSGFVLSQAYDSRIAAGMSFRHFAGARLRRLYPMIFAAALLAPIPYYLGGFGGPHPALAQVAAFTAAGFLLLPAGLLFHQPAFVLNGPLWSLFFELFANAVYFVQTQRGKLSRALLLAVLTCCAAALVLVIQHAGSAAAIGFASPAAFAAGAPRVLYSFSAGMFIHRFLPYQKFWRLPAWLLTAVLTLVLSCAGGAAARYDMIAILVIMPVMVALGANVAESPRFSEFWRFAGALSYPLYVLQEPVLRAVLALFHAAGMGAQPVLEAAMGTAASVLAAYTALVCYDEPIRKGKKAVAFLKKSSAKNFY